MKAFSVILVMLAGIVWVMGGLIVTAVDCGKSGINLSPIGSLIFRLPVKTYLKMLGLLFFAVALLVLAGLVSNDWNSIF